MSYHFNIAVSVKDLESMDTYTLKRILKNKLEKEEERKRHKLVWDERYFGSEKGFFSQLWNSIKKRCNQNSNYYKNSNRTPTINNGIRGRDHLLELWEKQKKLLGGPYCIYTGAELTTISRRGNGFIGSTKTNLSIDRIDPTLPYQENNIVFCSWEFNNKKNAVTPDDCKKILKVYEEHSARN